LAHLSGATNLRFWGKIFGTNKDYFVAEGILSQTEDEKAPCPDFE
jgi:hypothetical protein